MHICCYNPCKNINRIESDTEYNLSSPPLMCVGLVISWSNFSLARNLGRREVMSISKVYVCPKLYFNSSSEDTC